MTNTRANAIFDANYDLALRAAHYARSRYPQRGWKLADFQSCADQALYDVCVSELITTAVSPASLVRQATLKEMWTRLRSETNSFSGTDGYERRRSARARFAREHPEIDEADLTDAFNAEMRATRANAVKQGALYSRDDELYEVFRRISSLDVSITGAGDNISDLIIAVESMIPADALHQRYLHWIVVHGSTKPAHFAHDNNLPISVVRRVKATVDHAVADYLAAPAAVHRR